MKRLTNRLNVKEERFIEFSIVALMAIGALLAVECPRCSKEAFITVSNSRSLSNAQVKCFHCMFSQCAKDLVRYNLIVKRNCDKCGKLVNLSIPNQKEKVHSLTITCANCGITRILEPINALYRLTYQDHGKACDPVFNLPLWFQIEIRDNFF